MRRILIFIGGAMAMVAAHAASFDCRHAESKAEKLICGSPSLSTLDEKMASVYRTVRNGASAEERRRLVAEQRRWIKGVRNGCGDEACLAKAYASRVAQLAPASPPVAGDAPFARTDILANHPAPIGKGFPTILRPIDGDLVYSHYDDNGNTRSIVQFDFTNGHWTNLVSGKIDPALIAQNARYIVFHTPHSASFPIEVANRNTGTTLARIRLARPILDAFIQGDRLVLFQGQTGKYSFEQSVAILTLPSLKLIQETTLPGFKLVGIRGERIYTAFSANGRGDLMIFDLQFRELGRIQIPPPLDKINYSCGPFIEQNEDDRAVLIANCGEIHVLDLKSFSVVHSIRRYALSYSVALNDGFIFTTATDQYADPNGGIVVFDMATGKEVARFPIPASTIAIKGNILLAVGAPVSTGGDASWQMETYRINTDVIRKGVWQETKVEQQCRQAGAKLTATKDLYGAISLCKEAGIERYASGSPIPAAVLPALKQYGIWLSQTLDKFPDAVRILEKVLSAKPDPEVTHALNEARLKKKVVGGEGTVDLTEAERQTDFGLAFVNGGQIANATTKTLEIGSSPYLFYFSGDLLYMGRHGCRADCDGSETIGVFDRNTLDELASVKIIAEYDEDYQDSISSITADDKNIYVSVGYRYEQKGRPNFFVIDRKTLEVVKRAQVQSIGTLHVEGDKLVTCGCGFTLEEQTCAELNPNKLSLSEMPDEICVHDGPDNESFITVDKKTRGSAEFVAVTKDYLVARNGLYGINDEYVFYPRTGGQTLPPVRGLSKELSLPVSMDGNDIVTLQSMLGGQMVKLVSLPTGTVQTLFGLPVTTINILVTKLHQGALYVGYGRDLLIYDLSNHRLRRYIKDFMSAGFRDNGSGLDANRIDRLIIDRGRLIALTNYGENSRIIPLSDL
jgi:uncharacterized protein YecT (DUF1311 family)